MRFQGCVRSLSESVQGHVEFMLMALAHVLYTIPKDFVYQFRTHFKYTYQIYRHVA